MKVMITPQDKINAIKTALEELVNDGQYPDNSNDSARLIMVVKDVCEIEWVDTDSKQEAVQLLEEMIVISY